MSHLTRWLLVLAVLLLDQPSAAYELGDWDVHGTFSQGFIVSQDNNFIEDSKDGTFDFREFGVNASTVLGERVTVGGQLFGRKYGNIGNDDVYLDWLSVSYSLNDVVGFRAGKLKMPYGLYGETRDVDSLLTQVLLPQGVYVEAYRGSINAMWGGAIFGFIDSSSWGSFHYSAQLGQSDINEDSGELNRLASYIEVEVDKANDGDAGGMKLLWYTPAAGLRLGATFSWSEFDIAGPTDSLLGIPGRFNADLKDQYFLVTSAEYTNNRATISFEHLQSNIEAQLSLGSSAIPGIEFGVRMSGHYMNFDYRVTDSLILGAGYSMLSVAQKFPAVVGAAGGKEKQDGIYLSFRYDITPNLIAKMEQHFSTGQAGLFLNENPGGIKDDWSMTLFKISFVF